MKNVELQNIYDKKSIKAIKKTGDTTHTTTFIV